MENKERRAEFIDRDMLKYIALIPMAIGHFIAYMTEYGVIKGTSWWTVLITQMSLIAPPVFFFFVTEGFKYTRSRKQYALRMLAFALITQIPYCLANFGTLLTMEIFTNWSVIGTLFLGLAALMIWESELKMPVKIILILLLDALTVVLMFEWMLFGIPLILGLHIFRDRPKPRLIWFTCIVLMNSLISSGFIPGTSFFESMFFFMLSYFLITKCYNGKKGSHPVFAKWFFYIFYPLHLMLIYLAKVIFLAA